MAVITSVLNEPAASAAELNEFGEMELGLMELGLMELGLMELGLMDSLRAVPMSSSTSSGLAMHPTENSGATAQRTTAKS
jgi:hypothetical protein